MKLKIGMPAFAGMTLAAVALSASAADSILGKKGEPEFLPVDQAFEIQPLESRKKGELTVSWRIAKGYYLYRDRLKFALAAPAGARGGAGGPRGGKTPASALFAPPIVSRAPRVAALPVGAARGPYSVTVQYQGCADKGLCYPPQTRTLELTP